MRLRSASEEERARLRVAWDCSPRVCLDHLRGRDPDMMESFRQEWQEIYDEKGEVSEEKEFELWLKRWVNTSPPPRVSPRMEKMEEAKQRARERREEREEKKALRETIEEIALTDMRLAEKARKAFSDWLEEDDEDGRSVP